MTTEDRIYRDIGELHGRVDSLRRDIDQVREDLKEAQRVAAENRQIEAGQWDLLRTEMRGVREAVDKLSGALTATQQTVRDNQPTINRMKAAHVVVAGIVSVVIFTVSVWREEAKMLTARAWHWLRGQ